MLEVEEKEMFCCVLPEHEDKNPSANVFREKYGSWKYHCFGCDASLNTKQVVEVLGGFNSEYQAIIPLATLLDAAGKQSGIVIPFGGSSMVDGTLLYQWCVRDDGFIMNSKYSGEHIVFYCVI